MNTKIVYVLTSSESDFYVEQTRISVESLRMHSPGAYIVLVIDSDTDKVLNGIGGELRKLVDEIIVAHTPVGYTNVQKSRYIKTSLRGLVRGDFLFVDSDTVIAAPLDSIDDVDASVAAVKDKHMPINLHNCGNLIQSWANVIGWQITQEDNIYFNSGVFFVKDDKTAHTLYKRWHEIWKESNRVGMGIDQPSLGKANAEIGYVIKELPGVWNCQILENGLKYLSEAKIIHFFSSTLDNRGENAAYKLKDVRLYERIRNNGKIPEDIMNMLRFPKQAFKDRIVLLTDDEIELRSTPLYNKLKTLYIESPKKFNQMNRLRELTGKITRMLRIRK